MWHFVCALPYVDVFEKLALRRGKSFEKKRISEKARRVQWE